MSNNIIDNSKFLYEDYLIELKKNNKIRFISRQSWNVYKVKYWAEWALKFLQTKTINPWRTWIYKISDQDICDIKTAVKSWIDKEIIAKKYNVTSRSIYRYNKLECKEEKK